MGAELRRQLLACELARFDCGSFSGLDSAGELLGQSRNLRIDAGDRERARI
jgi:hypothetical protein